MFKALRRRLTVVCTLVTGVILIGMACFSLFWSQGQLTRREEAAFQSEVDAVLYHLRSQPVLDHTWLSQTEAGGGLVLYLELSGQPLLYRGSGEDAARAALVAQGKAAALEQTGFDLSQPSRADLTGEQMTFRFTDGTGQEYRAAGAALPMEQGWVGVLVLRSVAGEARELWSLRLAFAAFTAVALCLLALFAWRFIRWAVRPIEASRVRQMEFVHAASHELRSPIAVIRASLSALRGAPPEQAEHFTELVDSECVSLSRLVGDMLTLASADDGSWSIHRAEVEPETLLLGVYEAYEGMARTRGIGLAVSLPEAALPRCSWDGQRLGQVLSILTDNALTYAPGGSKVVLGVVPCPAGVRFTVADSGFGVPQELRERVFERFYRMDAARSDREHHGLGLCVAQELMRLHRGSIRIEETKGGGATFVIELPEG